MINIIFYLTIGLGLALIFYMLDDETHEEEKLKHFGLVTLFFPVMLPYYIYKRTKK